MLIERTDNEIIIRLPSSVDTNGIQRLLDFLRYKEVTSKSEAKQDDVHKLAREVNKEWWEKNKKRFIE